MNSTVTIVILSLIIVLLIRALYRKRKIIDVGRVLSNRNQMLKLSLQEYDQGEIDDIVMRIFGHVFHIDFGNLFDYVPPERREYALRMREMDKKFWKQYKLTPDFTIPADVVYKLYKTFVIEHLDEYPPQ